MSKEYERRLARAYDGEVFGEAMFDRMASLRSDRHEVEALETLAVLERAMRDALETLFEQLDIERPDHTAAKRRGREAAHAIGTETWPSFLATFDAGTTRALDGYSRLRAAPDRDDPALVALTSHEEALRAFAQLEQIAAPDSLAAVRSVIEHLRLPTRDPGS